MSRQVTGIGGPAEPRGSGPRHREAGVFPPAMRGDLSGHSHDPWRESRQRKSGQDVTDDFNSRGRSELLNRPRGLVGQGPLYNSFACLFWRQGPCTIPSDACT